MLETARLQSALARDFRLVLALFYQSASPGPLTTVMAKRTREAENGDAPAEAHPDASEGTTFVRVRLNRADSLARELLRR